MTNAHERRMAKVRRDLKAAEDQIRGLKFLGRLQDAYPDGRTLASVAEEEGWTEGESRRAVAAARSSDAAAGTIVYQSGSRVFFYVPELEPRPSREG